MAAFLSPMYLKSSLFSSSNLVPMLGELFAEREVANKFPCCNISSILEKELLTADGKETTSLSTYFNSLAKSIACWTIFSPDTLLGEVPCLSTNLNKSLLPALSLIYG